MYLLNQEKNFDITRAVNTLHSTMYLLNRDSTILTEKAWHISLHSTMYLLNRDTFSIDTNILALYIPQCIY